MNKRKEILRRQSRIEKEKYHRTKDLALQMHAAPVHFDLMKLTDLGP